MIGDRDRRRADHQGESMGIVEIVEPGGPDVLLLTEGARPVPGPGEVRVRVRVSGVNRADLLQRRGRYPPMPGSPEKVPGLEYSGEVDQLGAGCRLRALGDRVMGIVGGGGYAEWVVAPERETIRVPDGLTPEEAGAIPEVFITAWDALFLQANLRAGESVLIHAVGSGVGTAALQLARAAGAMTVGTSRSPEKVNRAIELGLDHGVLAEPGRDWTEGVRERLDGRGVDVVLDLVGASYLEGNQAILAEGGRWLVVGVPGGARGEVDLARLMAKRASIRGTVLRARPPEEKAVLARTFERVVVPLFEAGRLRPVIDRVLPVDSVREAHRAMEENRSFGKILLQWGDPDG